MASYNAQPLERLIDCFSQLSGVGRKGATRMAYQVLAMGENQAKEYSQAIMSVHSQIHRYPVCQTYTDKQVCPNCSNTHRD